MSLPEALSGRLSTVLDSHVGLLAGLAVVLIGAGVVAGMRTIGPARNSRRLWEQAVWLSPVTAARSQTQSSPPSRQGKDQADTACVGEDPEGLGELLRHGLVGEPLPHRGGLLRLHALDLAALQRDDGIGKRLHRCEDNTVS